MPPWEASSVGGQATKRRLNLGGIGGLCGRQSGPKPKGRPQRRMELQRETEPRVNSARNIDKKPDPCRVAHATGALGACLSPGLSTRGSESAARTPRPPTLGPHEKGPALRSIHASLVSRLTSWPFASRLELEAVSREPVALRDAIQRSVAQASSVGRPAPPPASAAGINGVDFCDQVKPDVCVCVCESVAALTSATSPILWGRLTRIPTRGPVLPRSYHSNIPTVDV